MAEIQKSSSDTAVGSDLVTLGTITPHSSDSAVGTETVHVTKYHNGVWIYPYGQPSTVKLTSAPTRPRDARTTHHIQDNT